MEITAEDLQVAFQFFKKRFQFGGIGHELFGTELGEFFGGSVGVAPEGGGLPDPAVDAEGGGIAVFLRKGLNGLCNDRLADQHAGRCGDLLLFH